ncbi:unnamed protein product [Rhizophagus irregularis]|nr:unnamed protein product [Rhizophagus irregularis]CAB5392192.1 unnamed protein product [Rhizophagus irregularis]
MTSQQGQVKLSKELPISEYDKKLILTNPSIFKNTKPYNPSSGSKRRAFLDKVAGGNGFKEKLPTYNESKKDSSVVAGRTIPPPPNYPVSIPDKINSIKGKVKSMTRRDTSFKNLVKK